MKQIMQTEEREERREGMMRVYVAEYGKTWEFPAEKMDEMMDWLVYTYPGCNLRFFEVDRGYEGKGLGKMSDLISNDF